MLHAALCRLLGLTGGSHKALALTFAALIPLLGACSDGSPTQPEDPNSIEAQIKSLFPHGASTQDAALAQIADIRQQIAQGASAQARPMVLALVDFTMTSFTSGKLVGGTSATAGNATSRLVNSLYQLVGMDPPNLPDGSLSNDGTAKVVGPEGATVVTPSGAAGVQIPAGAIPEAVLVTITKLPAPPTPGTGPLPTALKQYPPYYEFATYPAVVQFGDSLRVGVCQVTNPSDPLYPPEPHDRLRLAHTVGTALQILDRVDASDFLKCTGVSANRSASADRRGVIGLLTRFANRITKVFAPRELYAAPGGLGGKVRSFSPFGAVDPTLFYVAPSGTYLLTSSNDSALPPLIVDLNAQDIGAGDRIRLQRQGDWGFITGAPDDQTSMIGVFSATDILLASSSRNRVPDAIGIGLSFTTLPTHFGSLDTDIPQDFFIDDITVVVPTGAKYLFVSVSDSFFHDDSDSNGDFGIRITKVFP